ncbi:MAG TPA: HAD family hydrolase [Thermoanaerobaculia bacterium]|jgi:HAD superfamily hydrolase (TIGR01509 family)|nr:HAD family hydrolase [Thermoanaerobaculia bacterium]
MQQWSVRAVLFDWDGTLADTCESSYRAYARLFADLGIPFNREVFAQTYSPNWHHTYRCVGLPEERWTEADARWIDHFAKETTALVKGAREALEALAKRDVIRGIVTSGTRRRILGELKNLGVDHHFAHVVCGDDGHRRKPDPEALSKCLEHLGVAAEESAYIGDSAEDVMMARGAGVFSIGVRGTYPNHDGLVAASPDFMADSLAHAIDHLVR